MSAEQAALWSEALERFTDEVLNAAGKRYLMESEKKPTLAGICKAAEAIREERMRVQADPAPTAPTRGDGYFDWASFLAPGEFVLGHPTRSLENPGFEMRVNQDGYSELHLKEGFSWYRSHTGGWIVLADTDMRRLGAPLKPRRTQRYSLEVELENLSPIKGPS